MPHPLAQLRLRSGALLRTKSIEQSLTDADEPGYRLNKTLTAFDLTVFGVGVIIGSGVFILTGRVANDIAGPAVVLSFVLAAVCCALAAMCYAEFASTVPSSGSAYTFSYAALGEVFAWIIGWDLILEFLVAASVVAQGWSAYFGVFLDNLAGLTGDQHLLPRLVAYGATIDVPAMAVVVAMGALISVGIKASMRVNLVLVGVKLFVVVFVVAAGIGFINPANWSPFIPDACEVGAAGCPSGTPNTPGLAQPLIQWISSLFSDAAPTAFGPGGVVAGASMVFFAYIGFDVVATTAEETKDPKRNVPIGIIASLAICTVLYCAVSLVVTGMVHYDNLSRDGALASAFADVGEGWMATVIAAGAIAGLCTVTLTLLIGLTRLIFAMCRDNLLPLRLAKVHPTTRSPWVIVAVVTVVCALVAGLTPIIVLEEMVNIGTLAAFVLVSVAVLVLRKKRPDLHRPFRVPGAPVVPILSALVGLYLMAYLSVETWIRFHVWFVIGLVIYFGYSFRHSRVGTGKGLGPSVLGPSVLDPSVPDPSDAPASELAGVGVR